MIDWSSLKRRRKCHLSYKDKISAIKTAEDRGGYYKCALNYIFSCIGITHELTVASSSLWNTVTTLHGGHKYRLRPTSQQIWDCFESKELNVIRTIPGSSNIADALTKRNERTSKVLNDVCISDTMKSIEAIEMKVDKDTW